MNKQEILKQVDSYAILTRYLQPYHNQPKLTSGYNISNPFLPEKQETPSFNIYVNVPTGEWLYKDFATDDKGSCFDLVMGLFNLSFSEALEKVFQDFGLSSDSIQASPISQPTPPAPIVSKNFSIEEGAFTDEDNAFWNQYGITSEVLSRFSVCSLTSFARENKKGKMATISRLNNQLLFCYKNAGWVKLYQPLGEKKYRFQYLGSKPKDFIFGYEQLPKKDKIVIITGGEKDVLTLTSLGYNAISLNSETATLDANRAVELKQRFNHVVVIYDTDETGLKHSKILANEHKFMVYNLPVIEGAKDISDFVKHKHDLTSITSDLSATLEQKSNYKVSEIAKAANIAESATLQNSANTEDILNNMPNFDSVDFNALPHLLLEGAKVFSIDRERDVFLTAAMSILSGCLPNVSGIYAQETVYPNLFVFIIAPAASGKGALKFAKMMADKYQQRVIEQSQQEKQTYQMELEKHMEQSRKNKKHNISGPEKPEEPNFRVVYIPANTSSAAILGHLKQNDGSGIICETEADSMGAILKQDWGGYSDMLRKAFHHETISFSRKTDNEYIIIDAPKLSVALSGTPGQVSNIISSAEDGLFSRFMFYTFKVDHKWKDVSPNGSAINLTEHFKALAEKVSSLVEFLEVNPTEIELNSHQWGRINQLGQMWLNDITTFVTDDASSVVKRLGLVFYRLAMIFTALRKFEDGDTSKVIVCSDTDFMNAEALAKVYLEHSIMMYNKLPKKVEKEAFNGQSNKRQLFDFLPEVFKRSEAISLGMKVGMSERSVDSFLKKLCDTHLDKIANGKYQKIQADTGI